MKPPRQDQLFANEANPGADSELSLVTLLARAAPQNKAQATFQQLIARIESRRNALLQWQNYAQRYNERLTGEFMPLETKLLAARRGLVAALDTLLSRPAKGKTPGRRQREDLTEILLGLVEDLIDNHEGEPDEGLVALFDRYSDISHAERCESERALMDLLEGDIAGIDFPGASSDAGNAERREHRRRSMRDAFGFTDHDHVCNAGPGATRKGDAARARADAKAEAARAKAEQAAREVSQSIRDVYRKLASALHPDREPDPAERQRKTLLIQRVNQAYDAGDLLTLLGLQLQIEQIDADDLQAIPPDRIKHYIQVLREQLDDLDMEINEHASFFREFVGPTRGSLNPAQVDRYLNGNLELLRRSIRETDEDIIALRDPKQLPAFLRRYFSPPRDEDFDIAGLVDEMLAANPPPPPPRKRTRRR